MARHWGDKKYGSIWSSLERDRVSLVRDVLFPHEAAAWPSSIPFLFSYFPDLLSTSCLLFQIWGHWSCFSPDLDFGPFRVPSPRDVVPEFAFYCWFRVWICPDSLRRAPIRSRMASVDSELEISGFHRPRTLALCPYPWWPLAQCVASNLYGGRCNLAVLHPVPSLLVIYF